MYPISAYIQHLQTNFLRLFQDKGRTLRPIGMIASANLFILGISIIGSLIQAHFISPNDLGFVRKYSVIANYAAFLTLGLNILLQREYPVLIGRGQQDQAKQFVALVQSYSLLISGIVCSGIIIIIIVELTYGRFREASAWFIQLVAVWTIIYGGYLSSILRSGQEFERLAKGQYLNAMASIIVLPIFWIFPYTALILRSIISPLFTSVYLHIIRPVKVGWYWSTNDLRNIINRSMRLYMGDYLRYMFWLSVEIWLMLKLAGDFGVGLLVFSKMITDAMAQVPYAINQVYLPRLALRYGQSGSVRECLKLSLKPTLVNLGISLLATIGLWIILPPILQIAFPKYVLAIPLAKILALQSIVVSISLPLYMVVVLEGYNTQIIAAILGLVGFAIIAFLLSQLGLGPYSIGWGTLGGQLIFSSVNLGWVLIKARREKEGNIIT